MTAKEKTLPDTQQPMTLRALRDALNALPATVDMEQPALWWGEERGGSVVRLDVLTEEWIALDERDGCSPRSEVEKSGESFTEDEIEARIPAGTVRLAVD